MTSSTQEQHDKPETAAAQQQVTQAKPCKEQQEMSSHRAERLIHTEVSFIHSSDFEEPDAEDQILRLSDSQLAHGTGRRRAPKDVPSYLAHLWEVALLTPAEERRLFRRMNYCKYCANSLRSRLSPEHPDGAAMDLIEDRLADAQLVRNHIVQANLRLVVSIARKFVNDLTSLDELISDGNLILMKAVDRFDYSRGFRFSTYATHAVQREFYRRYKHGKRRRVMEIATDPEVLFNSVESPVDAMEQLHSEQQVSYLKQIMSSCLEPRELEIVDLRFGLKADDGGLTLREVGEALNISKERVRQLQNRAIEQIRDLARFKIEYAQL